VVVLASGARRYEETHVLRGVFTHLVSAKLQFRVSPRSRSLRREERRGRRRARVSLGSRAKKITDLVPLMRESIIIISDGSELRCTFIGVYDVVSDKAGGKKKPDIQENETRDVGAAADDFRSRIRSLLFTASASARSRGRCLSNYLFEKCHESLRKNGECIFVRISVSP